MRHDLRYAFRQLAAAPAFTFTAMLTLAMGVGATTAIFSTVNAVLLEATPLSGIGELAIVWETDRHSQTTREPASVPDYLDFVERSRAFGHLAAIAAGEVTLARSGRDSVRLASVQVTHGLLPMVGVRPFVGRSFRAGEDRPGAAPVALISEALWRGEFAADPAILGRAITLDERPATIVGVMKEGSDFGLLQVLSAAAYARGFADRGSRTAVDVWLPAQPDPEALPRSTHPIFVIGRLAPETTIEAAQQEMSAIALDLERAHEENDGRGVFVEPLEDVVFGPVRPALMTLVAAVGLVLLVACANVANLLLVRTAARRRELAIRTALGARALQLARQFLIENLLLVGVASALGVALAFGGLRVLVALAPPDVPRLDEATVDLRVLAVTAAIAGASALVLSLLPWWQARSLDPDTALRAQASSRSTSDRHGQRLRHALAAGELAVAVMLLVGAGLLIRSFWQIQQVDPGFRADTVLKAEFQLPDTRYPRDFGQWPNWGEVHRFNAALLREAAGLPGVQAVAVAGQHPLDPGFTNSFVIAGREAEAAAWPEIAVRTVSAGYFQAVGLPLVDGRLFGDSDDVVAAPVALINEAAARRFFAGTSPLGHRLSFWGITRTIVGVVADERFAGITRPAPVATYVPLAQVPLRSGGVLLVRADDDRQALASAVRQAIRNVDPEIAAFGIEPLQVTVSRTTAQRRFTMLLLTAFALAALLLGAIGVHGVLSYSVAQRTRELAIRLALGAEPARLSRLVLVEGSRLAGLGLGVGLLGALALTRVLRSQLFGVTASDGLTFALVGVTLGAVALAATVLPARRATRANPMEVLRLD